MVLRFGILHNNFDYFLILDLFDSLVSKFDPAILSEEKNWENFKHKLDFKSKQLKNFEDTDEDHLL